MAFEGGIAFIDRMVNVQHGDTTNFCWYRGSETAKVVQMKFD
ncbi:MAG: hypothetical protein N838_17470 [Thiohalocapsa sp. PB-PSB1]|jgi:hypothetical protein|nr:MAG: hypothetical protein N838_17470 [Thiohalocapsa sp. PB-PSB1]